ncbi:helix-turn-helix transcriptional regulator [Streptacidiphilus griseoplanus]|uniref:helix-turn-helix transcriptional regulator n=1 Tax=Peterkaempfera griseoplana TaxID=66896 RepID=UPI0006E19FCB|nr:helix-turn-helix domain-containing protein [Peterkaempfera griseoplana]
MADVHPRRPRRSAVLDALRAASSPLGVAEVAERLAVHPNTARFHLDALVAEGAADRLPGGRPGQPAQSGPGRPRARYAARPGMDRGGARGYRLLAEILVSRLSAAGPGAADEAAAAGRLWGRHLVASPQPYHRTTEAEAAEALLSLLTELGFAPEPATAGAGVPDRVRLRNCPFLELAETHGPVVCPLHHGLMQGALEELRAPLAATRLEPFAEPDACLARLAPAATAA